MSREYEAMRAQMTGGTALTMPRGLTLLMRRGLAAWLKTCSPLSPVAKIDARRSVAVPVPLTPSVELASLLADMVMKHGRWRHAF